MAEQHPAWGRNEVASVAQPLRRRGSAVVQTQDGIGEETAIETEGDEVGADGGEDEPCRIDGLAAVQGQHTPRGGAGQGDEGPGESGTHGEKGEQ